MTIVANKTDEELMQEFEQKQKAAKEQGKSFDNFFFFLREDEKAVVRPLMNIPQVTQTELAYHEMFDRTAGKMVADNVCAAPFGMKCKLCEQAQAEKKLKATPRVFLPVYVHGIWKRDLAGELVAVTAKDEAGKDVPVRGIRMLKLKLGSAILDDLKTVYYDSDDEPRKRSITTSDFSIERLGNGLDTRYVTNLRKKVLPITEQLPAYTVERVVSDVRLHKEEQAIEGQTEVDPADVAETEAMYRDLVAEQSQKAGAPAVPTMSLEETLDMKPPSPRQIAEIEALCRLLGKDFVQPLSFSQAKSLYKSLDDEYNALTEL